MNGQLDLFRGKRQRGRKPPSPTEFQTHCALADLIQRRLNPSWKATHLPLGEHRNLVTAAKLKRMGTRPGYPDFLFTGPNQSVFWLELKRKGTGRMSPAQCDVFAHLVTCGFSLLCTDDLDDAVSTLLDLGILVGLNNKQAV